MKNKTILLTGASGMLGSSIKEELASRGYKNVLTPTSKELDLMSHYLTSKYVIQNNPEIIIHCAAKVGGIVNNITNADDFYNINVTMQNNIIKASHAQRVKEFYFMSSSCCYPVDCSQPMKEQDIYEGEPEPTNAKYAIAKRKGMILLEDLTKLSEIINFKALNICLCNLFGKEKEFDPAKCHVIPALIKKLYDAKTNNLPGLDVLGTGNAEREFLYVEDAARIIVDIIEKRIIDKEIYINVGRGQAISIKQLVFLLKEIVGYQGEINFTGKTEGIKQKLLDISRLLSYNIKLDNATMDENMYMSYYLKKTYENFLVKTKFSFPGMKKGIVNIIGARSGVGKSYYR